MYLADNERRTQKKEGPGEWAMREYMELSRMVGDPEAYEERKRQSTVLASDRSSWVIWLFEKPHQEEFMKALAPYAAHFMRRQILELRWVGHLSSHSGGVSRTTEQRDV